MIAALSKTRSRSQLLTIHMRFLLLTILVIVCYNSNDARFFISDQLNNVSDIIDPNRKQISVFDMTELSQSLEKEVLHKPNLWVFPCSYL